MLTVDKYIYKVYEEGGFSAAAKALFVSQPALSMAISRHEESIGFKIFDRSVVPVALTPQGKVYIEYLDESIYSERNMRMRIENLGNMKYGSLNIGAYSYSAYQLLPAVISDFMAEYPEARICLDMGSMGSVENLKEKLDKHIIDIMLDYKYDPSKHNVVPIVRERMIIAMSRELPGSEKLLPYSVSRQDLLSRDYENLPVLSDLSLLRDIPFCHHSAFSSTSSKLKEILGEYKKSRCIIENARQVYMHYSLMRCGIAADMTSDFHISEWDDDLIYIIPDTDRAYRTLYMIFSKAGPENPMVEIFTRLTKEKYSAWNSVSDENI